MELTNIQGSAKEKTYEGKLFVANFMFRAIPAFSRLLRIALYHPIADY